jgi:hypothetical protein
LLYLSIDAVYQISLKSEMVGWTIVFWLDDLVWNVSPGTPANVATQGAGWAQKITSTGL